MIPDISAVGLRRAMLHCLAYMLAASGGGASILRRAGKDELPFVFRRVLYHPSHAACEVQTPPTW